MAEALEKLCNLLFAQDVKKNVAVVFISRMNEKGEPVNEGLCLQCAAKLGLPQVEDMMKRMGITRRIWRALAAR